MTPFLLVHGAWHGGWCWKRVRERLQAAGHTVFTPTLTGVGDRSHLLSPEVNLETHISDIVNLILWEDLADVVLCGHSYAGCVVQAVADRVATRIRSLVYVDAFVPDNGRSVIDYLPRELRNQMSMHWQVPPIPAEVFRVNPADMAMVNQKCTPQSLHTFDQPLMLSGAVNSIQNVTYIKADGFREGSPFEQFLAKADQRGWKTRHVPCGHDVMLDMPDELTALLIEAAG